MVTQKLGLPTWSYFTLLPVDLKLQPPFDELANGGHDPFPRFHDTDIDITVVCITAKLVSPLFQLLIQFVQNYVRSNWG
jgi:hypothetical protein